MTDPQAFDIEALIPHRAPMRLVDAVRSVDEEAIETEATVRSSWPTVENGCARTIILIEIVAQSAAALMGWRQHGTPDGRPGLLVGVPHATLCRPLLPVGTRLLCGVRLSRSLGSYYAIDGEVHDETGHKWLVASVQAYRPDDEELKTPASSRETEP